MGGIESLHGAFSPGMLLADLHVHGEEDDGRLSFERMALEARKAGLSAIGVSLHDNYSFGHDFYEYVQRNTIPLQVYAGSEVTATGRDGRDAHILAFQTEDDIRPYQSIPATLDEIYRRGGFAIIPHLDSDVGGSATFAEILATEIPVHIEVFNASVHHKYLLDRLLLRRPVNSNRLTRDTYLKHQQKLGAAVASSDAHKFKVGMGVTGYYEDLRADLEAKRTVAGRRRGLKGVELWYPEDVKIHDLKVKELDEWRLRVFERDLQPGEIVELPQAA